MGDALWRSFSETEWNGVRNNYVFVSFWYYYICILFRSSRAEVFLKKVFLKISQNSQETTCTGVTFFLWRDAAHCFPKSLTIFTKSSAVDVRLGHNYISLLPPDLKPIYKDFLLRKLLIKNATALYYHHRFIIQRGKIE